MRAITPRLDLRDVPNVRPPEQVLADRDACDEIAATVLGPNVLLLGDPPTGRSALDKRQREKQIPGSKLSNR